MPPGTAGFGNRDRFELNGKIGLHRAAGLIVLRECRQWQHNVALSASKLPETPFFGCDRLVGPIGSNANGELLVIWSKT